MCQARRWKLSGGRPYSQLRSRSSGAATWCVAAVGTLAAGMSAVGILAAGILSAGIISAPVSTATVFVSSALPDELGEAVRQAVDRVAPAVVRIRPIGSEQTTDGTNVNNAASTGVVVSADGLIVTSAFSVQGRPQAILVETGNGQRTPAEIIATDFVRKLVLLRAKEGQWTPIAPPTPVPSTPVPSSSGPSTAGPSRAAPAVVGQWAIAMGRFYSGETPSVSVGVVSALNRVHGMAIQTDAKISPVNYGGPLVDLSGNLLGVLVPLSPRDRDSADSGVEWYDSGIGFAIPVRDVLASVERLKAGEDLKPGKLGVSLRSSSVFSDDVTVQALHPGGPAAQAGLQKDDRITAVDGRTVHRTAVLESVVARSYAGDRIELSIERGKETLKLVVELADSLPVVEPAYLGLLPIALRERPAAPANAATEASPDKAAPDESATPKSAPKRQPGDDAPADPESDPAPGETPETPRFDLAEDERQLLAVVIEGGPAAAAGFSGTVHLQTIESMTVHSAGQARAALHEFRPDDSVPVTAVPVTEAGAEPPAADPPAADALPSVRVQLGKWPEQLMPLSDGLLAAYRGGSSEGGQTNSLDAPVAPGRHDLAIGKDGRLIVLDPEPAGGNRAPGLLVLLSSHDQTEETVLRAWQTVMRTHHLAIAMPRNADGVRLTAEDLRLVAVGAVQAARELQLDTGRLLVVARRAEAALAQTLIYADRTPFRGAALLDGWMMPETDQSVEFQLGRSVLLLDRSADRQSLALRTQAIRLTRASGLRVFSLPASPAADNSAETDVRAIADWSLIMKSF